ncbi:MAG: hypothetical protein OXB95_04295 [Rhodobacteraceae bacterium]|nr:hypothetical protein [Paracoccaceae bacterium]
MRRALAAAVNHGLDFLDGAVEPSGAWPSNEFHDRERPSVVHRAPFTAAHGILALEACGDSRANALRSRSQAFLHSCIEYPGVWKYHPVLAPDLDDTTLCSLAAPRHFWLLLGCNISLILSCRDEQGRFQTWKYPDNYAEDIPNIVDSVLNANVLAYLGDRPETRAAQRWLTKLVAESREQGTAPYYNSTMDLWAAMARTSAVAPPIFSELRPTLAKKVSEFLESGCDSIDALRMAQGLTALDQLTVSANERVVRLTLERLLETQCSDGSWPECPVWKGRDETPMGSFLSKSLTVACCVGAIARSLRT